MNTSTPIPHLYGLESILPFKAEVEALRVKYPAADATEAFYTEFMKLNGRIVAWLKAEYAVEIRSNSHMFRDTGKNMVMAFGIDLSNPAYCGLDAWITAETRTEPCGGNFGSQQVYEGSPLGRINRQTRALVSAYSMCQQERIAMPKRQLALEKKIEEWKKRLCDSIWLDFDGEYRIGPKRSMMSIIYEMRSAFISDRYYYMDIPKGVSNDQYLECPITLQIHKFAMKRGDQLVKEAKAKRKALTKCSEG
jgi:hypothetical protein